MPVVAFYPQTDVPVSGNDLTMRRITMTALAYFVTQQSEIGINVSSTETTAASA